MTTLRAAVALTLLATTAACGHNAPDAEPPHPLTTAIPSASSPPSPIASAMPSASASVSVAAPPDASAPVAATLPPPAGQPVTPRVSMKKLDDAYDGRANEGWPVFVYDGLPALSDDGRKLAVVEERDGWGHTPIPGVRIVDAATGKSLQFFALVPGKGGSGPEALPELAKLEPAFKTRIAAANDALGKAKWESLAEVAGDHDQDHDGWKVDGLAIGLDWDATGAGNLTKVTIRDASSNKVLVDRDATPWRRGASCATPDLRLIGSSRAKKIVAFSQQLGATLHDCDGVPIPVEYRIVRIPN